MSLAVTDSEDDYETDPTPDYSLFLRGQLAPGLRLREPLLVVVYRPSFDDSDFIVSEHRYYNHTARPTLTEAIADFRTELAYVYLMLHNEKHRLHRRLQNELEYLASITEAEKGSEYDFS